MLPVGFRLVCEWKTCNKCILNANNYLKRTLKAEMLKIVKNIQPQLKT